MIEADAEVAEQPRARRRTIEQRGIDGIGHGRAQGVGRGQRVGEFVGAERVIVGIGDEVVPFAQDVLDRRRPATGEDDARPAHRYAVSRR